MRLLLMACSARKNPDAGLLPAIQRYDGPAVRTLRAFQRAQPAAPLTVMILSAHYGLIPADLPIPWYNDRLTVARAATLRPQVARALADASAPHDGWTDTLIMLGTTYRLALPTDGCWTQPLGTLTFTQGGIGQQLGQLKRWLYTTETEHPHAH